MDVARQARVVLDADARMPVRGPREGAVAGNNVVGRGSRRSTPEEAREILVVMEARARGKNPGEQDPADEVAADQKKGRHQRYRVWEARVAVKPERMRLS
jgi:hypothetical protein